MQQIIKPAAIGATVVSGAIFGFFYAWVCSTMWGLDRLDPRIAIEAMNAMNGSVRNAVFAPAFFGTPLVLGLAAILLVKSNRRGAGVWFATAALTYLVLGMGLTMAVNVPMNEALALVSIPSDSAQAQVIWDTYSTKWQFWNQTRTVASGVAMLLACIGLTKVA
ncbi:MAG: anthrone oxygenase family protein [Litoreibacter sp.]|uniref:anthrone oxygenase family protein n=1 Tax=Litoreibacter sp. TaxID=1969459 RepID=UPI003296B010